MVRRSNDKFFNVACKIAARYKPVKYRVKILKTSKFYFMTMTVLCTLSYSFTVDSVSIVGTNAILELDNDRGIKVIPANDILRIYPTAHVDKLKNIYNEAVKQKTI